MGVRVSNEIQTPCGKSAQECPYTCVVGGCVRVHMCVHVAACVRAHAWVYGMCIAIVHASVRKGV